PRRRCRWKCARWARRAPKFHRISFEPLRTGAVRRRHGRAVVCDTPEKRLPMIVRTLEQARASERRVQAETWESTRLLLRNDRMGFSFHITTISAGTETPMHYQNPLEAVYCVSGEGEVETVADGKVYPIAPGTI